MKYLLLIYADEGAWTDSERIPGARKGTVEIRPIQELPGLPAVENAQF